MTSPRFSRAGLAIDSFGLGQQFLELGDPRLVGGMVEKNAGCWGPTESSRAKVCQNATASAGSYPALAT